MRPLNVSTVVFAAIWAKREAGEESEDAILRRLLGCPNEGCAPQGDERVALGSGVRDARNGVDFPEGFQIMRRYKGREFSAEARGGFWVRKDNGQQFPTINQLNASIAQGAENVWNGNWKYRASDGALRSIGTLRR